MALYAALTLLATPLHAQAPADATATASAAAASAAVASTAPAVPATLPAAVTPPAEEARELLAAGRVPQALLAARRAVEQQPGDYKGHYYLAYALMEMGETAAAQRAAEQAGGLAASPQAKDAVRALQQSMVAREGLKEADTAMAEGLHAKAARLYKQVWERGGLPGDKTLVAAELFEKRFDDLVLAVAMLRDLGTRQLGTPAADEAAKRLQTLAPQLKERAQKAVESALKLEPDDPERRRWLSAALDLDEANDAAQTALTNDAAELNDWPALERQLKLLQRRGSLQALMARGQLALGRWQAHPGLRELLADIWGPAQAGTLLAGNKAMQGELSPERQTRQRERREAQVQQQFRAAGLVAGTGAAFRDCADCPEMTWLPAGAMPPRPQGAPLDVWLAQVRMPLPFAMGKFEVTFDEWSRCVADRVCPDTAEGVTPGMLIDTRWGRGRQPVINISQQQARDYAQWLAKKTGQPYRLMSFSEYVYALQAGQPFPVDNRVGNCHGCSNTAERTLPAGSLPPNPWGVADLIGNVFEMVEDCYPDTKQASKWPLDGQPITQGCATRDPHVPPTLGDRVAYLGGSHASPRPAEAGRFMILSAYERQVVHQIAGFRVVRDYLPRSAVAGGAGPAVGGE